MVVRLNDILIEKQEKEFYNKRPIRINDLKNEGRIKMNNKHIDRVWDNWIEQGAIRNNTHLIERDYRGIKNAWNNEPCFIVACGPALKEFISEMGFDFLNGRHTIGINHIIEDYDLFEWFLFLDQRFLVKTTYDMQKFKGKIFAQNKCNLYHGGNVVLFKVNSKRPSENIEDGLFNGNLSGITALNLALISGANPIYMLGYGEGSGSNFNSYHYKDNYTGETKDKKTYDKFQTVKLQYQPFAKYANKIIHVTNGNDIPWFKKMRINQFKNKFNYVPSEKNNNSLSIIPRLPNIVHLSFSNNTNDHADITRAILNNGYGNHSIINVNQENIPNADFYIYEHFLSTKIKEKEFQYKSKAIDIVHTVNCIPTGEWKKIICLTDCWKKHLTSHNVDANKMIVVNGGINIDEYKNILPDYSKKIFGRITRYSPGKIHPEWNMIVKEILDKYDDSKCLLYTHLDNVGDRQPLKHERMIYNKTIEISDFKGGALKQLSIYVHANGSFKETMSHAVIEAMATGLPIIYLNEPAVKEIVGGCGIECQNIQEVKAAIIQLLNSQEDREKYGALAKKRSLLYNVNNFVAKINDIVKENLK
jgi:glycosyltransferase involved in cell wall biosynthesis